LQNAAPRNPFAVNVEFKQTQQHEPVAIEAEIGEKLSSLAERAGVEIQYKCRKGECGTCQVKVDGKWVKACQGSVIAPSGPKVRVICVHLNSTLTYLWYMNS
jgi:ferredoxin